MTKSYLSDAAQEGPEPLKCVCGCSSVGSSTCLLSKVSGVQASPTAPGQVWEIS